MKKDPDNFDPSDCPRRYCWWWKSLDFDWGCSVAEGCTFLTSKKHPDWKFADIPCKRSDPASEIDHFEPRDTTIIEDSFDVPKVTE